MSVITIILFVVLAGFYAGLETGGYLLNRIRLRFRARHGDRAAHRLQRVLADAHLFIFTVLIGHNIAVYLVSRKVTQLYLHSGAFEKSDALFGFLPWNAEMASTLTLVIPLFIFAEIIPKNLFHRNPDSLMYRTSGWLLFSWTVFRPLTTLLKMFFNLLTGGRGGSDVLSGSSLSLQGFRDYFSEESRCATLSDHQHGMIDHLVAMHRVPACDVMQPLATIISISDQSTIEKTLGLMRSRHVEQVAVYHGGGRCLTGFVSLFDLMNSEVELTDSIQGVVRKMVRVPARLPISQVFQQLRTSAGSPAVVLDRSSLAVGMLQLRDIAEYIVSDS